MQWDRILNPPTPEIGYAFEYEGNDYASFRGVDNEEWETVVLTSDDVRNARYVGRRQIDDGLVLVYEVPVTDSRWNRRWIAQWPGGTQIR